jgi:hypothetical protein
LLSRFDQSIFDALATDDWRRPTDLIKKNSALLEYWIADGDTAFLYRLEQWADHSPKNPALERREDHDNRNPFRASYRLTSLGARIRNEGITVPEEAPSLFVGGCRVYSSKRIWVRRDHQETWRIEEL